MRPAIQYQKVKLLRQLYTEGINATWASAEASVSPTTAYSYFRRFKREGAVRGADRRRPHRPHARWPKYTGPDWIG